MQIKVRTININYIQYGDGEDVILLHGWGQNIQMMDPLGKSIHNKRITIIDLPGFGSSSEPSKALTVYDYADILHDLVKRLDIKKPALIGHSFGGRIAIIYASKYEVDKLVLFGSPCIRHQNKESLKVKMLKSLKKVPGLNKLSEIAKSYIGSTDYRNASPVMREILVNTVNEDLSECAKKITCPTLLIWGDLDEQAPIEEAEELEQIMQDAALITLENGTHYAYLEQLGRVQAILNHFL